MSGATSVHQHPLFDLIKKFRDMFESGNQNGFSTLRQSKPIIDAYYLEKISSPERSPELDDYMESLLYFCMKRIMGLLLDTKEFDEHMKANLLNFQGKLQSSRDQEEIPAASENHDNRRELHSPEAKDILAHWFNTHSHHPYPTKEEVSVLSEKTGLAIEQVRHWFNNARKRRRSASSKL